MDTINNDSNNEEWNMTTSPINMSNQHPHSDEEFMVINNNNSNNTHDIDITCNNIAHNRECVVLKDIVSRSATLCHPNKITITDGCHYQQHQ